MISGMRVEISHRTSANPRHRDWDWHILDIEHKKLMKLGKDPYRRERENFSMTVLL